jgi:hypothetical protein
MGVGTFFQDLRTLPCPHSCHQRPALARYSPLPSRDVDKKALSDPRQRTNPASAPGHSKGLMQVAYVGTENLADVDVLASRRRVLALRRGHGVERDARWQQRMENVERRNCPTRCVPAEREKMSGGRSSLWRPPEKVIHTAHPLPGFSGPSSSYLCSLVFWVGIPVSALNSQIRDRRRTSLSQLA